MFFHRIGISGNRQRRARRHHHLGFGPATPPQPSGQQVATAAPLANPVQISIGGLAASVQYSGLVQSGLYQFNVTVPNLPNGDAAVLATVGGITTQTGVSVTVQQ